MRESMESDQKIIRPESVKAFEEYLVERENSSATIEKYLRDVRTFLRYMGADGVMRKDVLLAYKSWLLEHYSVNSVNSMLVALNQFLTFLELGRMRLKRVKIQTQHLRPAGRDLGKGDFQKLVRCARASGSEKTAMIMETIGATGVRVSELKFFRVENVRSGMIRVQNKGKYRMVLLPKLLQKKLLLYTKKYGIYSGVIFRTRSGRAKDRSNIWKDMKRAAQMAGVNTDKVFPHNFRHLFARTFYKQTKNLINLADILGHSSVDVTRIYASEGIAEWQKNLERVNLLEVTT